MKGPWKSRKNKKRAQIRRRAFIKGAARTERQARPVLTDVGQAIRTIAGRMGKRGQ